jgi:hypothetical protein
MNAHPKPLSPYRILSQLDDLREALSTCFERELQVLRIDMNRGVPMIEVTDLPRNRRIGQAAVYAVSRDARGQVRRYQVQLSGCRVEWERVGGRTTDLH